MAAADGPMCGRVPGAVVGVLLAAGRAERFGGDKRLARLPDGTPLAVASCRRLVDALGDVVAVVRPDDVELAAALKATGASVAACADADRGMGRSLARGVETAIDAKGWIVALADMPWIVTSTLSAIARCIEQGASVAAPVHRGRRGHPVGFAALHRDALLGLEGDRGARSVIEGAGAAVTLIEVDDPGVLRDVDVPEDLAG